MGDGERLRFAVEGAGEVSAILMRPANARWLLVLAHGAGAGMTHPFLENLARELGAAGVATFRYQFPYMEERRRVPDSPAVATATVASAVRAASKAAAGLPLLAGGKSFGARMSSQAAALGLLEGVKGLVFFGFPLHPPNKPGVKRAEHLAKVRIPMLFLQGTRDTLADLKLLRPICADLESLATLHVIETADHSFHVLKSSGKTDADVMRELANTAISWADHLEKGD
jgi:predicted alpha/beta-hydrolase family hydrolase